MTTPALFAESILQEQVSNADLIKLHQGEVLLKTRPHTFCGGSLEARILLPLGRSQVWETLTHYPRWVSLLPDVTQSRVLEENSKQPHLGKRLFQAAEKSFLFITAQVHVYLKVFELEQQHIRFQLERGSFTDFTADIHLSDLQDGTLLSYTVSATPSIPVPSFVVEQAMKMDLPNNLRYLRTMISRMTHKPSIEK